MPKEGILLVKEVILYFLFTMKQELELYIRRQSYYECCGFGARDSSIWAYEKTLIPTLV